MSENPSHVISGLLSKRSELVSKINYYYQEIEKLNKDLTHVEKTIKIIDSSVSLKEQKVKIYRKPNEHFNHGQLSKIVIDILRESDTPLKTDDIISIVKEQYHIYADLFQPVRNALTYHRSNGRVKEVNNEHLFKEKLWTIAEIDI